MKKLYVMAFCSAFLVFATLTYAQGIPNSSKMTTPAQQSKDIKTIPDKASNDKNLPIQNPDVCVPTITQDCVDSVVLLSGTNNFLDECLYNGISGVANSDKGLYSANLCKLTSNGGTYKDKKNLNLDVKMHCKIKTRVWGANSIKFRNFFGPTKEICQEAMLKREISRYYVDEMDKLYCPLLKVIKIDNSEYFIRSNFIKKIGDASSDTDCDLPGLTEPILSVD